MKRTILTLLFMSVLLPLAAQERADTAYVFRFVPDKDMFYVPYNGNDKELARLEACVKRHKDDILAGNIPLHVDGYCNSAATEKENLAIARTRSNRVKSELIIRSGLTESCFTTRNHSGGGDYVAVRMVVPKAEVKEVKPTEENRAEPPKDAECSLPVESQKESVAETSVEQEALQGQLVSLPVKPYTFALRANLLRWATLTPDLGVEWRINRNWGILVNGSWTSWSWDDKNRRYALWEVSPEVRWYLGKEKRGYLGAMYKAGSFNYKFSETGRQGDLMGGGLTGGYRLKLNRSFDLDFTLGVGCLHADYEKYTVTDGVRVKQGEGCKNYWGVTNAGITLVWKLK